MLKRIITVTVGGESFPACWDMAAWATFEKLSGGNAFEGFRISAANVLDALWAGIDSAAAHQDKPAPISRRRLGTLITSMAEMDRAMLIVTDLIAAFMPEVPAGKAEGGTVTPSHSPSPAAINTEPLILASESGSSGG